MTMRVEAIRTEDLSEAARDEIVALCVASHGRDDFRRLFTNHIPSGGRHFIAFADDAIVSHAVVTTRWFQPDGHPAQRTAYVDAVSTLPDREGRGYGSAVMRALTAGVDDFQIACLETDIEGFYARLGWETWRGPLAGRTDDGLVPTPDQTGIMVYRLPHTPDIDLDAPASIEVQRDRIW